MAKKHVSHYFDIEFINDIAKHAEIEGRSRTSFIANAVKWYIRKVYEENSVGSGLGHQPAGSADRRDGQQ